MSNVARLEYAELYGRPVDIDAAPPYVSERGTDLCVVCRADTGIPSETPADQRQHYVEGVGQCCAQCAARIASGEF